MPLPSEWEAAAFFSYTIISMEKCITVGVVYICKIFRASKLMASFTGKPFGKDKGTPCLYEPRILFD